LVTDIGFLLVGFVLGSMQILTELRRDQWAFLTHRPLTMNTIFFGKAAPGALLYLLATLVPLLAMAWWMSTPGARPAPFDWRMVWPGLVDVVIGLGFYFAALWSGIMRGPWYGRRMLPLLAAYFALKMAGGNYVSLRNMWDVTVVTVLALFLAAWAGYRTSGNFRREPWWGKAATVLSVLLALGLVSIWLMAICGWLFPEQRGKSRSYVITRQGELAQRIDTRYGVEAVVTLDGEKLTPPDGKEKFAWEDFLNAAYVSFVPPKNEVFPPWFLRRGGEAYRYERTLHQMAYNDISGETWYYLVKAKQFVVYDLKTRLVSGYLGPHGFDKQSAPAGAFMRNQWRGYWSRNEPWVDGDTIYRISLDRRRLDELFKAPDGEKLIMARQVYERGKEGFGDSLVATDRFIRVLDSEGLVTLQLPTDELLKKGLGTMRLSRMPDKAKTFLIFESIERKSATKPLFVELDAKGEEVRRLELEREPWKRNYPLTFATLKFTPLDTLGQSLWNEFRQRVVYREIYLVRRWQDADFRQFQLVSWGISLLAGVVCAGVALRFIGRLKLSLTERTVWLMFIVFYGVGGLLAFWLVNDWPTRSACPRCGKKRSVADADCEHCGASWPLPVRDGTEIFEDSR
ncbi:MAG: hypothetical protein LBK71_06280, partial [Verrucomicrobiales bacterium]|jgi:hypothetical protein|nr:hypothetical protein [Verrucomicrobiales bacterium]